MLGLYYCEICHGIFEDIEDDVCAECAEILALDLTITLNFDLRNIGIE
jgi:hypothetical protein